MSFDILLRILGHWRRSDESRVFGILGIKMLMRHVNRFCPRVVLLLLLGFSVPSTASAQLEGHFALSKTSYSAGEPVYLIFEVENLANQPVTIKVANPFTFCGGYKIELERAKRQDTFGCYSGQAGSCTFSEEVLRPGEKHVDRILLNRGFDLRQPGTYPLHVTHQLLYALGDGGVMTLTLDGPHETFDTDLAIVLEASTESELKDEFRRYVEDLHSDDWHRRFEAAQVIANLAPPFLEDTILQMLDSPELRSVAVRGLHALGTPAAHQALVNFVKNSPPTQPVGAYQEAIRYLGDIGDHGDVTLLLQVAHRNESGSYSQEAAIESAGRAGGDDAIPFLVHELQDESADVRQSAVRALYLTGSRNAVPVLIELLRSDEARLSGTAEFGLQVLTHFTAGSRSGALPAASYAKWNQWWSTYRESATIFKYDQCGPMGQIE